MAMEAARLDVYVAYSNNRLMSLASVCFMSVLCLFYVCVLLCSTCVLSVLFGIKLSSSDHPLPILLLIIFSRHRP